MRQEHRTTSSDLGSGRSVRRLTAGNRQTSFGTTLYAEQTSLLRGSLHPQRSLPPPSQPLQAVLVHDSEEAPPLIRG